MCDFEVKRLQFENFLLSEKVKRSEIKCCYLKYMLRRKIEEKNILIDAIKTIIRQLESLIHFIKVNKSYAKLTKS